ncbi:hypothetical protein [Leucobacter soli]|uniref:hypothetical protein n=1 Tax=Leucobacter soli TaxID=2812850 RepID=UPI00362134DB
MPLDRVAARVPRLRAHLRSRRRLMADGLSEAGLRTAVNHGQILRILPGRYVSADDWRELEREDRHLLRAIAVEQGRGRRRSSPTSPRRSCMIYPCCISRTPTCTCPRSTCRARLRTGGERSAIPTRSPRRR